jgi:hypothetical protein
VTVHPLPSAPFISLTGSFLTSSAGSGNQWYNSSTGIISGATAITYIPTASGIFYVILTDVNGCKPDTSNVISFIYNGINELNNQVFTLYPNPFSSQVTLQTDKLFHNATISLDNCFGQTVKEFKNKSGQVITFNRDDLPSGLYFIRLTDDANTYTGKVLITDN